MLLLGGGRCWPADERAASRPLLPERGGERGAHAGELQALLSAAGSSATELAGHAGFKRALAQLRSGDARGAMRAFDSTARSAPGLADWALYFAAFAAAATGDTSSASARVAQLDADFRQAYGWRALSRAHENAGMLARAIAIADAASKQIQGPRRFEASVETARLLVAQGDSARGRSRLGLAVDSASTPTRLKAATLLRSLFPNKSEWLSIARAERAAGHATAALEGYTRAGTPIADLERAQVLFTQRKYVAVTSQLKSNAGGSALDGEAQLLLARAELRLGNSAKARADLRLVVENPQAPALARAGAAYILGDLAQDANRNLEANDWFRSAIDAMPASEPAANAFMRLGLDAFTERDFARAVAIFSEYAGAHARTNFAQQALYWNARAHEQDGQKAKSRTLMQEMVALDPFSYYGLTGQQSLSAPPVTLQQGPLTSAQVQQQVRGALRRVRLLELLELPEAASFERERTRVYLEQQRAGLHFLAEELQREGRFAEAIAVGRKLYGIDRGWNQRTLRLLYPFPYRATIERNARAHGISPYLLAALIRQESTFNPRARSTAGAIGLMQVMPKTGRAVAARLGMKRFVPRQLTDPEVNVRIGTAHFHNLLRAYDSRLEHAIAAYNAGVTPVARWLSRPLYDDAGIFSERIPYAETREYVKILLRNMKMYELLYGVNRPPAITI